MDTRTVPDRRGLTRAAERTGLALALLGVVGVVVWMLALSQANADRAAEEKARRVSAVEQCFAQAASTPALDDVFTAIEVIARNQLTYSSLSPTDFAATNRALESLYSFHAQMQATAPTVKECRDQADELGIQGRPR